MHTTTHSHGITNQQHIWKGERMSHARNRVHLSETMLRRHFGGQIYDAAPEENDLKFHCLDVEVLGVNKNLRLITVIVQKLRIT